MDGCAYTTGGIKLSLPPGETVRIRLTNAPAKVTGLTNVEQLPPEFVLVPIVDRGVEYCTPREHSGTKVDGTDPLIVAELGLRFYEKYVAQLSRKFESELDSIPSPHPGAISARKPSD